MPHCYVEKLVSFLSRKLVSGFFTNRRTVEMGESVWESFFPYFQEEKSGKSRLVKLEGYDNFNTWKLYYFVCQFCWIEVPVVSIQSYTCPTISHPEPNYPYDFTVDQVVQQLSLVETMLRKKKYVRWCVWKKKGVHPQHHDVMSSNVDTVSLLTCCDHCVCFPTLDTCASLQMSLKCWPQVSPNLGEMEFVTIERQFLNRAWNKDFFFFWRCFFKHWEIIKKSDIMS